MCTENEKEETGEGIKYCGYSNLESAINTEIGEEAENFVRKLIGRKRPKNVSSDCFDEFIFHENGKPVGLIEIKTFSTTTGEKRLRFDINSALQLSIWKGCIKDKIPMYLVVVFYDRQALIDDLKTKGVKRVRKIRL